jgi:hypothetical protein
MGTQDEGGEIEAAPGVDPRQGRRGGHRRLGVARASEPGAGPGGGSLERGDPPRSLGRRPGGDQTIEIGRSGPGGVGRRRDVVRAAGPRGGRGKPSDACEHEARDEPARRAAPPELWLHADRFRGSRRAHSSHRTRAGCRSAFCDGTEHSTLYPDTIPIASVTLGLDGAAGCRGSEGCAARGRGTGREPPNPPASRGDGR